MMGPHRAGCVCVDCEDRRGKIVLESHGRRAGKMLAEYERGKEEGRREGRDEFIDDGARWVAENCAGRYESGAARAIEFRAAMRYLASPPTGGPAARHCDHADLAAGPYRERTCPVHGARPTETTGGSEYTWRDLELRLAVRAWLHGRNPGPHFTDAENAVARAYYGPGEVAPPPSDRPTESAPRYQCGGAGKPWCPWCPDCDDTGKAGR